MGATVQNVLVEYSRATTLCEETWQWGRCIRMDQNRIVGEYDRYLSPLDVWAIAFGCTVGWGAFMMPGTTFLPVAGPLGTVIAMAVSVVRISST